MSITQPSDYVQEHGIAQNSYTDLDSYISKYERYYLVRLLGAELYDAFVADLTGDPQVPDSIIYETIFEPLHYDSSGLVVESAGIKEMLKGFIYYHYCTENNLLHTIGGMISNVSENSQAQLGSYGSTYVKHKYGKAINNFHNIQLYIEDNKSYYPAYNGQNLLEHGGHF